MKIPTKLRTAAYWLSLPFCFFLLIVSLLLSDVAIAMIDDETLYNEL